MCMLVGSGTSPEDLDGRKHFSEVLFEATFAVAGISRGFGTGFALGCPDSKHMYLVTARHVLDSLTGDSAIIYHRKRLTDGTYEVIQDTIPIRQGTKKLYFVHPDSLVDVAALRLSLPNDSALLKQFTPIWRGLLATDEDIRKYWIHPGDQLFYLGFPAGQTSPQGIFPVLRSGVISSYPILPLLSNPFVYVDGPIFGGNSGGPIYFEYTAASWNGRAINLNSMIVGLISYGKYPEFTSKTDTLVQRRDIQMGGFVNSAFITQLLDSIGCQ